MPRTATPDCSIRPQSRLHLLLEHAGAANNVPEFTVPKRNANFCGHDTWDEITALQGQDLSNICYFNATGFDDARPPCGGP